MESKIKEKINKLNILVFGDFMVDEYVYGSVNRISPEAPVPVLNLKSTEKKIGGAGNVINNIVSLGANVRALGRIGNDENGRFIKNYFSERKVDCKYLFEDIKYQTIVKTRVVSHNQQFIRIDKEDIVDISKEFVKDINSKLVKILDNIDIVVISDYGKGSITSNSLEKVIKVANEKKIPIIVDPKGNDYSKYRGVTLCTPNLKELSDVVGKKISSEEDILENSAKLIKDEKLQYLILTRSADGISLIDKKGNKEDFPLKYDMDQICKLANVAASVVVSKFGTSTVSLDEMNNIIEDEYNDKIINLDRLEKVVTELRNKGKKISFTNGCFDLLHAGHIDSLTQSKSFGDVLIVGVNSDNSVKKNKGPNRPIIQEKFRLMMLSSLECVDYLVLMDDDTAENLVKIIKPDYYVKGYDYKDIVTPETKIVNSYGGKCEYVKIKNNISTSKIIERIKDIYNE